jgi:hypothetical protein
MGNCITSCNDNNNEKGKKTDIISSHKVKISHHYTVVYPNHKKRTNSYLYNKTHDELINKLNMPCFICNKSKDQIQLETHHFYCEKAGESAIDWIKFGEFAKNCYNIQTGENIGNNFDWEYISTNPELFVDSKYNMIVLCIDHHRSGNKGIHHVPFPEWILQKNAKDGFEFLI